MSRGTPSRTIGLCHVTHLGLMQPYRGAPPTKRKRAVTDADTVCVPSEIDVAADHLEELVIEWGPDGVDAGEAKTLARALNGTVPIIAGAGLTTAIAYRWKTQINENAKTPAYSQELPEMDHNEIEGWTAPGEFGRFSAVFLDDDDRAVRGQPLHDGATDPAGAAGDDRGGR